MEKLFDDTLFVQKERPTKITEQQEGKMYLELAKDCIEQQFSSDDEETIAEDLKELYFCDSGYEQAKDLERNGKASYEINGEFIDWLDWIGHKRSEILSENVKLWVRAHNPQRKFEKGTKLKIVSTLNREKLAGEIVYITGFREDEANYLVDKDQNRQGGTVISYEKVEANCEVSE
jgi:hypothetical protein